MALSRSGWLHWWRSAHRSQTPALTWSDGNPFNKACTLPGEALVNKFQEQHANGLQHLPPSIMQILACQSLLGLHNRTGCNLPV